MWSPAGYRAARARANLSSPVLAAKLRAKLGDQRGLSSRSVQAWGDDASPGAPGWTWAALERILGSREFLATPSRKPVRR